MEVSVLNIKGQETGRKVTLNEAIFGIEPNDHVLYLDVKQYLLTSVRVQLSQRREAKSLVLLVSLDVRRVAAVPVMEISTHLCCVVVVVCLVLHLVTTASS